RVREGSLLVRGGRLADPRESARVVTGRVVGAAIADVRIAGGRIEAVAPALEPGTDEAVLDAGERVVLPGVHDHHLHLRSLAARGRSVGVGPADASGAEAMARLLRDAPADRSGWRRAVGYHESVAGDLDRRALDAMVPGAPVRVQHRSGVMWVLNSAAVDALGVEEAREPGIERDAAGRATGRLFRMDAWLARRLPGEASTTDVAEVSRRLAGLGVTGITDATPGATPEAVAELGEALREGRLLQRAHLMCPAGLSVPRHPLLTRGPEKLMLDDDRLPALDALAESIARAHGAGLPVAVHCVTAVQLVLTVAALEVAGTRAGDRIEHGAVVPRDVLPRLAALRATLVVNPGLLFDRGDTYLDEVDERDLPDLLRGASLHAAGIPVAAGTDAPFGSPDPWLAVAAAHRRRTSAGRALGPEEALDEATALALFSGDPRDPARPRRVEVGAPGDLCILDGDALPAPAGSGGPVPATVVAGRVVHCTIPEWDG
ncbi:MAG TPA: amidohydrolase family protein, partial [Acidimicrobiales bacterium]|nr:amidohydrolase family protein [Acidimicrobiales bacterium]